MYKIPLNLDLTKIVGCVATQILVGQFDIQFSFGEVRFVVQSRIDLVRDDQIIGSWREGRWPDSQFYEVMNTNVLGYKIPTEREVVIYLSNEISMHLHDDSDQFECIRIAIEGEKSEWVI